MKTPHLTEAWIHQILADGKITEEEALDLVRRWNQQQKFASVQVVNVLKDYGIDKYVVSETQKIIYKELYLPDNQFRVYTDENSPFKEEVKPIRKSRLTPQKKQKLVWLSIVTPAVITSLLGLL
jgi:hypothetical protein